MRVEKKISSFKNHRIHGILPEAITNELVQFSMFPGESIDFLIDDGSDISNKSVRSH